MTSEQLDRWASEIRRRDHGTTHWDGCEESHPRCRELALIARVRELEAERDEWRALTITPRGAQYYIDKAAQAEAERDRLAAEVERLRELLREARGALEPLKVSQFTIWGISRTLAERIDAALAEAPTPAREEGQ